MRRELIERAWEMFEIDYSKTNVIENTRGWKIKHKLSWWERKTSKNWWEES